MITFRIRVVKDVQGFKTFFLSIGFTLSYAWDRNENKKKVRMCERKERLIEIGRIKLAATNAGNFISGSYLLANIN